MPTPRDLLDKARGDLLKPMNYIITITEETGEPIEHYRRRIEGIDAEVAKRVITLIAAGSIPAVTIKY